MLRHVDAAHARAADLHLFLARLEEASPEIVVAAVDLRPPDVEGDAEDEPADGALSAETMSCAPWWSRQTTGRPAAWASCNTVPLVSRRLVKTKT